MKFEKRGQDMLWNFRREGIVFTLIFLLFEFMNVFIWVHVFIFCAFFVFGACLYVCVHAQIYARTNSYTKHAHTNSCTNIHVHTDIHIYMYTNIYIHVHTHTYTCTHKHTHINIHVYTHIIWRMTTPLIVMLELVGTSPFTLFGRCSLYLDLPVAIDLPDIMSLLNNVFKVIYLQLWFIEHVLLR